MKRLWNDGWEFQLFEVGEDTEKVLEKGDGWERVEMPHDWLIYDTENLYKNGDGWYRKTFLYQPSDKMTALRFDGVYMNSEYYVNQKKVFEWKYGYSAFEFDITKYLNEGENTVHVRVRYQSPNSRWYSGAGIYRKVCILERPAAHLVSDGIYVATEPKKEGFCVTVSTEVTCGEGVRVVHSLYAPDGALVWETDEGAVSYGFERKSLHAAAGAFAAQESGEGNTGDVFSDTQEFFVKAPERWSIETPTLYVLRTQLRTAGYSSTAPEEAKTQGAGAADMVLDEITQKIGFRELRFDTEQGLFLNGEHIKLYGACEHHDLGCLGAAFRLPALRRQFTELKKMGVNALRTSHNMPAEEFMELADEMGFLVDAEAFDMWERNKTTYDYACYFKEWYKKDVASWVRRDRNHACLLLWSIGNEIYDTHADARGLEITKMLRDEVRVHDPLGNAPVTIGSNYMPWENARKCANELKYAGYNYAEKYYEEHHKEHPDWYIYGSETASTTQSRGIYRFPYEESVLCDDDEQCSSLGNSTTSWGAKSTEYCITMDRDAAFSAGQFIWTGFDYIGEPTPYSTKNSYLGQIDTAGFWKDTAYLYCAEWTDYKTSPMVHIFPYWDFSKGQPVDVRICSNAPVVELFVNGSSKGTYQIDHERGTQLTGNWKIPYEPGEITAVAYDENGNEIARETEYSFGDPVRICMKPEKEVLTADGTDLLFVEIEVWDKDGHPVRNARNRIHVSVAGAARLVGLDNGDSTDYDQYKATNRRLFSGKLLAVLAATRETGEIRVTASSRELEEAELVLSAVPPRDGCEEETTDFFECNEAKEESYFAALAKRSGEMAVERLKQKMAEEIPVRRIDISCEGTHTLSPERTEVVLTAKILPENATYREIFWRLTTSGGVDANFAALQRVSADPAGHEQKSENLAAGGQDGADSKKLLTSRPGGIELGERVILKALGDGKLKVRCNSKNGEEKLRVISELEFEINGLGKTALDPYGFIAGALYSRSIGTVTNGNEHGVATMRDKKTTVIFDRVEFGPFGSDEITLPIFELDNAEQLIEIWRGVPGEEDSEKIDTVSYFVPSIWNTYQPRTYVLPKRFCGMQTISFVVERKLHLKGFSFQKKEKAFEKLYAAEHDAIYGDSYSIGEREITGIGNNVTIGFDGMDFGEEGTARLIICGKSRLEKNTIHVRFCGENGDVNQIAEFVGCGEYTEQVFELKRVCRKNTVNFVFMPGCDFDFLWFRFEK